MEIAEWTKDEIEYCVSLIPKWRSETFRGKEALIADIIRSGKLKHGEEELWLRMKYLDKLTAGEFSSYELLTIPPEDKQLAGILKR